RVVSSRLFANDIVVIYDSRLVVLRPVVPLRDVHEVSSLGVSNCLQVVSCLRRLLTLGILQEEILERLSGKNERGKILRTRGQSQLHVNVGNLVEGIVTDIA